ncbi:DNA adenine methylase [Brevibacterium album]|uniref:DNA adenine methylase n=1 Tax=Brevibacterium album TaxID=417948 RepID=UPI001FE19964|nr:DNA adenine methylase [Brevibacterium album]
MHLQSGDDIDANTVKMSRELRVLPGNSGAARREVLTSAEVLERAQRFPRLRYMGSKYRLLPHLERVFAQVGGTTAVDAFSGSGVVSYLLKAQGFQVTSNDFLNFPSVIARATVQNSSVRLDDETVETILGPPADDRDFIQSTFDGLYFTTEDRKFLDSAWSHIDRITGYKKDIAIAALVLSAARKQPRGVFTFTDSTRYADGRRDLQLSLREHFRERVAAYNAVVFSNKLRSQSLRGDVLDIPTRAPDIAYLDPPYAPPRDDNDYIKRYHFLEGLSVYWRDVKIMENTKTKKLEKRYTPFAYKRTIENALSGTFEHFKDAGAIVLSYSSNAIPGEERIVELLGQFKSLVEVVSIDHKYHFGTHAAATRRDVSEFLFIGRDE